MAAGAVSGVFIVAEKAATPATTTSAHTPARTIGNVPFRYEDFKRGESSGPSALSGGWRREAWSSSDWESAMCPFPPYPVLLPQPGNGRSCGLPAGRRRSGEVMPLGYGSAFPMLTQLFTPHAGPGESHEY